MDRRTFLIGTGTGLTTIASLTSSARASEDRAILKILKAQIGTRNKVAGMVAVTLDEDHVRTTTYGSSGNTNVALNSRSVFEIMSNTKVLTSLLLADMVERDEVAFDDPVSKYLPPNLKLQELGRPVCLADLATYTSGLPNMPSNLPTNWYAFPNPLVDYTQDQLFEFLSGFKPKYPPGSHYEYGNVGFGLLGIALARRAGRGYEDLLIERICNPLRLDHTRITLDAQMKRDLVQGHDLNLNPTHLWDWPAMPGGGCVRSTAHDLTRFIKACLGNVHSALDGPLRLMTEIRRPTALPGTMAGLGWFITEDDHGEIVWKSGLSGGCNTFMGYSREKRKGAVLLSNYLWQPIDAGTIQMGVRLINPNFPDVDFNAIYPH